MSSISHTGRFLVGNRWAFRALGVGLFVLILFKVDLREAWRDLSSVDPLYLVLSLVFQLVGFALATLRWQLIMNRLGILLPLRNVFLYQVIGTAAGIVTPGEVGEISKVWYVRRKGFPAAEAFFAVLFDRLCDFLALLFFGFIALAFLFGIPTPLSLVVAIVVSLFLIFAFTLSSGRERRRQWIASSLARVSPKAYKEVVERDASRLLSKLTEFDLSTLSLILLATIGNYTFLLLRVYAFFPALHLSVPFWYFMMVIPLLRLVGLVPISVAGVGTRDVTAIYLLGRVGITASSSLIVSTLGLITLQVQALVGLVAWWLWMHQTGKGDRERLQPPVLKDTAKETVVS